MCNILISYFSDYGEAMYDAITETLLNQNNNIFRFNINRPDVKITTWGGESELLNKDILSQIKNFNPDIVFNFNHSLPKNLYEVLSIKCKIVILDADNPETFWNKEIILRNFKKYKFLGFQSYSKEMYERFLCTKLHEGIDYIYFPPATIIKSEKKDKNINISFIGSNFLPANIPPFNSNFYTTDALKLYNKFKDDYFFSIDDAKKIVSSKDIDWLYEIVRSYYVGQDRLKYLQILSDLGLVIFGLRWWKFVAYYDFDLFSCFSPIPIRTISENQDIYNSSKISINISHPQAKTSFSWRVMDIMASDSCLVMEYKKDWMDLFAHLLSKETLDATIYKDRFDMRNKVLRLLNDEELRIRCIKDFNHAIESNGRWNKRYLLLNKFLSVNLFNDIHSDPTYIHIPSKIDFFEESDETPKSQKTNRKNLLKRIKLKNRFKLLFYGIQLIFAQLPILGLLYNRHNRKKIIRSINKYMR